MGKASKYAINLQVVDSFEVFHQDTCSHLPMNSLKINTSHNL